jgi:Animal haem peroxidase
MGQSSGKKLLTAVGLIGAGVVAGLLIAEAMNNSRREQSSIRGVSPLSRLLARLTYSLDRVVPWHRQPVPLGVLGLIGMRAKLRDENLHDTDIIPSTIQPVPERKDQRYLTARTPDGTYNDLADPLMGAIGTRFGRNSPFSQSFPEQKPDLMEPSPREVSRRLLAREGFIPASTLNLMAGAWLQFMIHDWFSHGKNDKDNIIQIPLKAGDSWSHGNPMTFLGTTKDPTRPSGSYDAYPPTFLNHETHWWDGSQLYGTDLETLQKVRSGEQGKLRIESNGLLPVDEHGVDLTGENGNYWIGLSMLHTLFVREHNAICDHLQDKHPNWSDDELFDHARLINSALMAKIHTVEWTPGIVAHPTVKYGMRGNWWGLLGEQFYQRHGHIGSNDFLSGIPGSTANHHTAPYALTEEFVAVYRMHPLLPDGFSFRSAADDQVLQERIFPEVEAFETRKRMEEMSLTDLFYSFGTSHPGAVTLHNFPRFLRELRRHDGRFIDLASIDVFRDRERGVPRYNQFRQMLHTPPVKTFEELTNNPEWAAQIKEVYQGDIDRVDLMVGLYSEPLPQGFGFSETAFRIFSLMASRRLKSDRFFTTDYRPEVYTPEGLAWINETDMSTVLLRHLPALKPFLSHVSNAFAPWPRAGA